MYNPVSTYRIQLHKGFQLKDLQQIIPYLEKLGIRTVYASPLLEAVPGSQHGYDGTNTERINPEIGTLDEWKALRKSMDEKGMGWLQDIVPNHMAYHHHNRWLMDVLKKGRASDYITYFDIYAQEGRPLLAPFLSDFPEMVIAKSELQVVSHQQTFWLKHQEQLFPLNVASQQEILQLHADPTKALQLANEDDFLLHLLHRQHYILSHWQTTDHTINYRRFFTINQLIALNVQHPQVFEKTHQFYLNWLNKGLIQGLRVDHVDGLYDPGGYLDLLREQAGEEAYLIVEKILAKNESLPEAWPIQGETGYHFLALVNQLLTDPRSETTLQTFYQTISGNTLDYGLQALEKKSLILSNYMQGEWNYVFGLLKKLIPPGKLHGKEDLLQEALGQFMVHCPVYRYYADHLPPTGKDAAALKNVFRLAQQTKPRLKAALDLLEQVLFNEKEDEPFNAERLHFYRRCMQLCSPLMAKGIEDTLFYTYAACIAHNEVGDVPNGLGIDVAAFHAAMIQRQAQSPLALNATATHDTKRGEDSRARLHRIAHLPEEWCAQVKQWHLQNLALKTGLGPDANEEYFIYQTLLGALPMNAEVDTAFLERLDQYLIKALREAKVHTNWSQPDAAYEASVLEFSRKLLEPENPFYKDFCRFHQRSVDYGMIHSLVQLILKCTCPGVPDIYQGSELWDLSFADPDNRRPVDYALREKWLDTWEKEKENLLPELWANRHSGAIKLCLLQQLLRLRQTQPLLFEKGDYVPLTVKGKYKEQVLAFARQYEDTYCVVTVLLHAEQTSLQTETLHLDWEDTAITLPKEMPGQWNELISGHTGTCTESLALKDICAVFPFAVLQIQKKNNPRAAGVLLPVSALPGAHDIGDFGPAAHSFINFLKRSGQSYWQLLPLNPTHASQSHSPYNSVSGMAMNTLFISPEFLQRDGLLEAEDLKARPSDQSNQVAYLKATRLRHTLFQKAWKHFHNGEFKQLRKSFQDFCETEQYWLDDFVNFHLIKSKLGQSPWYTWPEPYRYREAKALSALNQELRDDALYLRWLQFIAHKQWQELKAHGHQQGIQLMGDLPFYPSHDSVEVWAHPEFFSLDDQGFVNGLSGVPPDYFSKTGQLWGMPTFRWDRLKEDNYTWWMQRLEKNLELFDRLRIDHFRALAAYWEVPAGNTTAIYGQWLKGPGEHFFAVAKARFGALPFIAEDLGDNMEDVYLLREAVGLQGMKVLQFAFGENMPHCVDIPHNYPQHSVVYTGTHDNNTTRGWYRQETTEEDRKRINSYTGKQVNEKNCHQAMIVLAYASVAQLAIVPMQDWLGLDEQARMNTPGTADNNWGWRLSAEQLNKSLEKKMLLLTEVYNRL